jgi:Zn-dependent protease
MTGSLRLGTFSGIPVFVHWTFLLLLGFVALSQLVVSGSIAVAMSGVALVAVIFGCVVLHEFGHALAARRYGIGTRDVTLLPIGGIARLDRMPHSPKQELRVALAGPAVNLAIAGLLGVWLFLASPGMTGGSFAARLLSVNLALAVFNMLPAFPMDGGRVLRALLAQRIGHFEATEVAAKIGRGVAVVFGIIGLLWNPMLILIALFVWFGAGQEAAMARRRAAFGTDWPSGRRRFYRAGPWLVYRDEWISED